MSESPASIIFSPDGQNAAQVNSQGQLSVTNDSRLEDLSKRLRTSNPIVLEDFIFEYLIPERLFFNSTASGASLSHTPLFSSARLQVGTASSSECLLITNKSYSYQAGSTLELSCTFFLESEIASNQVLDVGMFDSDNGVFLRLTDGGANFVIRTNTSGSPSESIIPQASWNKDQFTGLDGYSQPISWTNGQILTLRYRWLGYGNIEFQINDKIAHIESNSNIRNVPYMRTASLPFCTRLYNTDISTANSVYVTCLRVLLDGASKPHKRFFSVSQPSKVVGTTLVPVLSIRPKASFGTVTNKKIIIPELLSAYTNGGRTEVQLILNPSVLGGAIWASVDDQSAVEFDLSATTVTGGTSLISFYLPRTQDAFIQNLNRIFDKYLETLRVSADGVPDTLVVVARKDSGGVTSFSASVTWSE